MVRYARFDFVLKIAKFVEAQPARLSDPEGFCSVWQYRCPLRIPEVDGKHSITSITLLRLLFDI